MGSIILCHKKKARQPFELVRVQRKIYTIEELCYYLCNHLYLIDHTVMNEALCSWLEEELELGELAESLRQILTQNGSVEQFIVTILAHSSIYTTVELREIQNVLEKLKNQKPIEKQKYKADSLMESGALKSAVVIYQSILHGDVDETVDKKFYGRVYGCLGAAYGRLFLYKDAAAMYEAAFQICEEESMLKSYLYACSKYMTETEWNALLKRSPIFQGIYRGIQEEVEQIRPKISGLGEEDTIENWKEQYRKTGTGER